MDFNVAEYPTLSYTFRINGKVCDNIAVAFCAPIKLNKIINDKPKHLQS